MKKILNILSFFVFFFSLPLFSESNLTKIKHNPWELIIYRPENKTDFNSVRCFVKIEDENGNDVSRTKVKATYEWASIPGVVNNYKKKLYLDGGMAMHLNLKKGKYRFSVYTPREWQCGFSSDNKNKWESNVFEYDTENPAKVIFVTPVVNDNGFYAGEWWIDFKAPRFFKFSEGKIKTD
ncbi:MAG: hypothetical protein II821_00490 [Treponema sp.]|nr:hypothetical protein [Treponema sp.]